MVNLPPGNIPPGQYPGGMYGGQFPGQLPGGIPGGQFPGGAPGQLMPGQMPGGFPGQMPGGQFPGEIPGGPFRGFPQQGGPGQPPFTPPGQQRRQQQAPTSAPPQFIPERPFGIRAIDPGAIYGCLYRMTFIWLDNGGSFWFFPTFIGRRSIAGYRWRPRRGWIYFGIDLDEIESFSCNPRRRRGQ